MVASAPATNPLLQKLFGQKKSLGGSRSKVDTGKRSIVSVRKSGLGNKRNIVKMSDPK